MKDKTNLIIGIIVIILIGFIIWPVLRGGRVSNTDTTATTGETSADGASDGLGTAEPTGDATTTTTSPTGQTITVGTPAMASHTMTVKVFFPNRVQDPGMKMCQRVFPVSRTLPATPAMARAALTQLLAGPTSSDIAAGYVTAINPGVVLKDIHIASGIATVDLSSTFTTNVIDNCRLTAIKAQVTETLRQFGTVRTVLIMVNGKVQ